VFCTPQGIAQGVCSAAADVNRACDEAALLKQLHNLNLLPELIRMQCSMLGAWGDATPDGGVVQLRSLDFGAGPFANRSVLVVHHPTDTPSPFASLAFPGFVMAVTGFSPHVGLSEKVMDVYSPERRAAGSYQGQPVVSVLRDILQDARSAADAVAIAEEASRTWSVWVGVGDSTSFVGMSYTQAELDVLDDSSMPGRTNQTAYKDLVYVDKHPQPSHDQDTMPSLMDRLYGNITADNVAQFVPRGMQSGDVHTMVLDFAQKRALVSVGVMDASGNTQVWAACLANATYLTLSAVHVVNFNQARGYKPVTTVCKNTFCLTLSTCDGLQS